MSSCILLQKVLSEMQAENQQRLKDREQELKDLKKVMEVMKVGQKNFSFVAFFKMKATFPINPANFSYFI